MNNKKIFPISDRPEAIPWSSKIPRTQETLDKIRPHLNLAVLYAALQEVANAQESRLKTDTAA